MGKLCSICAFVLLSANSLLAQGTIAQFTWHGDSNFFQAMFQVPMSDLQPGVQFSDMYMQTLAVTNPVGQYYHGGDSTSAGSGYYIPWDLSAQLNDFQRLYAPNLGWIRYAHLSETRTNNPVGVPEQAEVEARAFDMLFQLGIDRSLVAHDPRKILGTQGKLDPEGNKISTNVNVRGISFNRSINGAKMYWNGLTVEFGTGGKIKTFELSWRNLEPVEIRDVVPSHELLERIKSGKAFRLSAPMRGELEPKRLSVVSVTPYYQGDNELDPQGLVYPFGKIGLLAYYADTNSTFQVNCPILAEPAAKP
jgi:hypothetical protein